MAQRPRHLPDRSDCSDCSAHDRASAAGKQSIVKIKHPAASSPASLAAPASPWCADFSRPVRRNAMPAHPTRLASTFQPLACHAVIYEHGFCYIPCFPWQHLNHASRPSRSSPAPSELRLLRRKGNACAARRGGLPVSRRTRAPVAMRTVRGLDRDIRTQHSQPPARPAGECRIAGMESKTPRRPGTHGGGKGQARWREHLRGKIKGL